jgi:hypothetical protein
MLTSLIILCIITSQLVAAYLFRKTISHQRHLSIVYEILSLSKFVAVTTDTILLCIKDPVPKLLSFALHLLLPSLVPFYLMNSQEM